MTRPVPMLGVVLALSILFYVTLAIWLVVR